MTTAPLQTELWFDRDTARRTLTAIDRSWDSGNLSPRGSFVRRFDTHGVYPYVCRCHPWMTNKVPGQPDLGRALPEKAELARPTGVGRGIATYEIPIEGRDEWLAAARRLA